MIWFCLCLIWMWLSNYLHYSGILLSKIHEYVFLRSCCRLLKNITFLMNSPDCTLCTETSNASLILADNANVRVNCSFWYRSDWTLKSKLELDLDENSCLSQVALVLSPVEHSVSLWWAVLRLIGYPFSQSVITQTSPKCPTRPLMMYYPQCEIL